MADVTGQCLCGSVGYAVSGPLASMTHCHCTRCRKAHGANYATYAMCATNDFRLTRGQEHIAHYASSPLGQRPFCKLCGSVVPDGAEMFGMVGIPSGTLDGDPGITTLAHIFVGSKAPWHDISDTLPQFETLPPGFDTPVLASPERAAHDGGPRSSCLCGEVVWEMTGTPLWSRHCHCGRCRRQRSAAHATNVVVRDDGVRFLSGAALVTAYKLPGAQFFTHAFCRTCGSSVARIDPARQLGILPMGAFDDDPGVRPQEHIFTGSKAPWHTITDSLPQYEAFPPKT